MPKTPQVPSKEELKKRLADAARGIQPGVDFGTVEHAEQLPTLIDLGIPLLVRKKIAADVANHLELGKIAKQATADRDAITKRVRETLEQYAPADETPSLICEGAKIRRWVATRESFSKSVARDELLNLGVRPDIVAKAWTKAVTVTPTPTMRISAPGDSEE